MKKVVMLAAALVFFVYFAPILGAAFR